MPVTDFDTWNRQLHISVPGGELDPSLLRDRTLSLIYTDRTREFDHIEWVLDNWDGQFTQVETLMAGLVVQIRIGYLDGAFPWKTFIVNRARGGVGVYGVENPMVGEGERRLTYFGRNRNAPGGGSPTKLSWKNRVPPESMAKKPRAKKGYPPTSDLAGRDFLLKSSGPRQVSGRTVGQLIQEIATRNGFDREYQKIQDAPDTVQGGQVLIPEGMTDGQFVEMMARKLGYVYKIDDKGFHFHQSTWPGAKHEIVELFTYGAGPDILSLSIDADFRLPLPRTIKGRGWNPDVRVMLTGDIAALDRGVADVNLDLVYEKIRQQNPSAWEALSREDKFWSTGTQATMSEKAKRRFLDRHLRAFVLNVETVGNPRLLAGYLVQIKGTNSPFVDRVWRIDEVRHMYMGEDYRCQLHLKQPPKAGITGGKTAPYLTGDEAYTDSTGKVAYDTVYVKGDPGAYRAEKAPPALRAR